MAGGSIRWEADPLFSAAEVVQDSADRMESLYRLLLHEQKLIHEENKDNKLLSSIQYHKRDLVTAVETSKWQLEDFERAVYFASLSDETGLRENAISRHKQFINAIREQIVLVEKCLEEITIGDSNRSLERTNLNEPDAVALAFFLSASNSMDQHEQYNSENSIMKRFFDSTGNNEIIELGPEEVHLQVDDMRHPTHASSSSKENKSWEFGPNHSEGPGLESSVFPQEDMRENGCRTSVAATYNAELGKSYTKYLFFWNRLIRYLLGILNTVWFTNKYRFSRNFMKRRKDGELTDDIAEDLDEHRNKSHFSLNIFTARQCKQAWMGLTSRFDRSQRFVQYITFHMRSAFVLLVTVAILGLLVFSFT